MTGLPPMATVMPAMVPYGRGRGPEPPAQASAPSAPSAPSAASAASSDVAPGSVSQPVDQSISSAMLESSDAMSDSGAGAPSPRYASIAADSPTSVPASSDRIHFCSRTSQ